MTTRLTRLIQARSSIDLTNKWIREHNFTQTTFSNPAHGSEDYKARAAILKEFESVAENLNFPKEDPIRKKHAEFWKTTSSLYGMRSIIAHRYGVADIDYAKVWLALTDSIPKQIVPTVDELIKENEDESKDD